VPTARAACYGRISDPAEDEGESLKRQEAACRAYCREHGYEVVAVYRDAKTGVAFRDREGLRELRLALPRGEFEVVVIRELDRLTRHQAHLYLFMEECEDAGVRVEFVNERFEDTPEGRLLRSVRAYVAEVEREKIIWRTQNGRRDRIRAGRPLPGGRPPYGYRWGDAEKTR
jgi:site-specific DNA recombinase